MLSATTATPVEIARTLLHAGHPFSLRGIEAPDLAAEHRAARDHSVLHAGQPHVDSEHRTAVGLLRRVQPLHRLAHQPVLRRVLQRRTRRRWHQGCRFGQRAVAQVGAGGGIDHRAVLRAQSGLVHCPLLGRGLHQHLPRRRSRAPQRIVGRANARAAEDALHAAVLPAHRRELGADLRPVALQFLGQQLGQGGHGPLPHLRLVDEQCDHVVRAHVHERVQLVARGRCGTARRQHCADPQPRRRAQEAAPAQIRARAHFTPPLRCISAARCTALRIC